MSFLITIMIISGLYSGVIGLCINFFCQDKVLHYCWIERDIQKAKKWNKYQSRQLIIQYVALAIYLSSTAIFFLMRYDIV